MVHRTCGGGDDQALLAEHRAVGLVNHPHAAVVVQKGLHLPADVQGVHRRSKQDDVRPQHGVQDPPRPLTAIAAVFLIEAPEAGDAAVRTIPGQEELYDLRLREAGEDLLSDMPGAALPLGAVYNAYIHALGPHP